MDCPAAMGNAQARGAKASVPVSEERISVKAVQMYECSAVSLPSCRLHRHSFVSICDEVDAFIAIE